MGMVINTNLAALNTYNKLNKNSNAMNSSLEKLSSGYQINSAADDAAGLAISEKMRSQIRGLDQASDNSQNAISLVQTAEGALQESEDILQRMRELAVQASSDTLTDDDRTAIQDEITSLSSEIDRIANTTEFNTKNLLDGSMSGKVASSVANVNTNAALASTASGAAVAATTQLDSLYNSDGTALGIASGNTVTVSYMINGSLYTNTVTVSGATTLDDIFTSSGLSALTVSGSAVNIAASGVGTANAVYGLTVKVTDATGNENYTATKALSSFTETTAAADQKNTDGTATVLIGANTGQTISININNMDATSLGVKGLDVSTVDSADVAISTIDSAISKVSAQRSSLGAIENRLDHTINNLTTASENLTSAESLIRDVDMASEMATYTKYSVMTQAATSMLAQANQQPSQVLTLLK